MGNTTGASGWTAVNERLFLFIYVGNNKMLCYAARTDQDADCVEYVGGRCVDDVA